MSGHHPPPGMPHRHSAHPASWVADFAHLQVPERGLDGAANEALVGLPRGHIRWSDGRVLVQEFGHGRIGLWRAAFRCLLEQPAELDVGLLLGLGGGLEADLAPGERVGPDVHGDAK